MKLKKGDVKIVSQEESLWTKMKDALELDIKRAKELITINEAFLEIANKKLEEAKDDKTWKDN